MQRPRRSRMSLSVVAATVGGMGLIGWAVAEVLPGAQTAALVFGVVLIAYAAANARPSAPPDRTDSSAMTD